MRRSLTLVIHALNSGGAERVLTTLANHWVDAGVEVTLITLADTQSDRYQVRPNVRRVGLGLLKPSRSIWQAIWNNRRRVSQLRRAIRESGAHRVVSFTDNINVLTLLACRRLKVPVVIAERNDPRHQRLGRVWEQLRRASYPRCEKAVAQTEGVAEHLRLLVRGRPVEVIANGVDVPEISAEDLLEPPPKRPYIAAMGRLDRQKGFDLLIQAFAKISQKNADWDLRILGEGDHLEALQRKASELGIARRVFFAGWMDQPAPLLRNAGLFVLSSRWEGFPNALLQAMACSTAAISFSCDSGPADIVRHEVDGLLVPPGNIDELAKAMDRLIRDPNLRNQLGVRAREVVERFSYDEFFTRWDRAVGLID